MITVSVISLPTLTRDPSNLETSKSPSSCPHPYILLCIPPTWHRASASFLGHCKSSKMVSLSSRYSLASQCWQSYPEAQSDYRILPSPQPSSVSSLFSWSPKGGPAGLQPHPLLPPCALATSQALLSPSLACAFPSPWLLRSRKS